jgi:hypothetical protein
MPAGHYRRVMLDLFAAGGQLPAATGARVALCRTHGAGGSPVDPPLPVLGRPA